MASKKSGISPSTLNFVAIVIAFSAVSGIEELNFQLEGWVDELPVKGMATSAVAQDKHSFDQIYAVELRRGDRTNTGDQDSRLNVEAFTEQETLRPPEEGISSAELMKQIEPIAEEPRKNTVRIAEQRNEQLRQEQRNRLQVVTNRIRLSGVTRNGAFLNGQFVALGEPVPNVHYSGFNGEAIAPRLLKVEGTTVWLTDGTFSTKLSTES